MEDAIALGALRRMSVDVANLTSQLALAQSGVENLMLLAKGLMPDLWGRQMTEPDAENGQHPESVLTIQGEQADALMRLLAALETLG